MKTLFATLAVVLVAGCSAMAEPVGKRTPNGGFEYYSNHHKDQGTEENGCILRWEHQDRHTLGHNPKRVDHADMTNFVDCKIPKKVVTETVVVIQPVPAPTPAPAPAPVVEAPAPAPAPAPVMPAPVAPKPIKE